RRRSVTGLSPVDLKKIKKAVVSKQNTLAKLMELDDPEAWRKDVDNSQLWRMFGLESAAGRTLKSIYTPPYVPPHALGRSRSTKKMSRTADTPFLRRSNSLPHIVPNRKGQAALDPNQLSVDGGSAAWHIT
ncbi:unnamed protein product, partial [Polarella glacialis]